MFEVHTQKSTKSSDASSLILFQGMNEKQLNKPGMRRSLTNMTHVNHPNEQSDWLKNVVGILTLESVLTGH